jgi:D-lactate dehydrogenase
LFNKENLSLMKKGAMLINTARGGVLDTNAALDLLKSGHLGALGIDVYEAEKDIFFKDLSNAVVLDDTIERLLTLPNVLVTPHQGFFTTEAVKEICTTTIQNITDFENGRKSKNEI